MTDDQGRFADQLAPTRLQWPSRTALHALGRIEAKVDMLVDREGAKAPPAPPVISQLARDIGEDKLDLPACVRVSRAMDGAGEFATLLSYGALTLTVDEAVRLGVLQATPTAPMGTLRWTWNHYLAGVLAHSISVERGESLAGARPGRARW